MTGIATSPYVDSVSVTNAGGAAWATQGTWNSPSGLRVQKLYISQQISAGGATAIWRIATVTGEGVGASGAGSKRFIELAAGAVYQVDLLAFSGTLYITNAAADTTARLWAVHYWA